MSRAGRSSKTNCFFTNNKVDAKARRMKEMERCLITLTIKDNSRKCNRVGIDIKKKNIKFV